MIDHFLKYLEYEKRSSKHTVTSYQEDLQQLQKFLQSTFEINDFSEVKHPHLRNWVIDLMENGLSPSSINRKIACLKSFFKFLKGREYVDANPATKLKPLKTEKRLPTFVQEQELMHLLDSENFDSSDFSSVRDRLVLELFYGTGIRLSELIGLQLLDFQEFEKTIKVLGKRNKERVIPVPDSIVYNTKTYLALRNTMFGTTNKHLLLTNKGQRLYPMFVQRLVAKHLGTASSLSKKSPHVLRHTFATHLLEKGADLNAVKDLLGHTSLAATQVYTHNSIEKLKSAFDQAHPKA